MNLIIDMKMPKNCNECNFSYCGQCQVNNEWICDYETNIRPNQCPIVCDIQEIRDEIEQTANEYEKYRAYSNARGLRVALDIIDNYTKE